MSEKQKSAAKTTEKVMTKYDRKVQRRKEEELKEQKRKKIYRIIGAAAALVIVAFIAYFPISRYMATHSVYFSVGDNKITELEFDYYYNAGVNDYLTQYGSYVSYLGLDTTKDFASQQYSENFTWDDFFQQNAVNGITRTKALISEAKANGFEYDTKSDTDDHIENLKQAAANADMTVDNYVKAYFGKYATLKNIRPFIEESYYASKYYAEVGKQKAASDEEISAYYEENKDTYDSVDYKVTEVAAKIPEGEETTDAEGNKTTADPTEEQIAEAMKAAKAQADEKLETIDADGELKENVRRSAAASVCRDWLFDAARQAGDSTVIEDETNHKYYVLQFEKRYLDDTATVNVRVIMSTEDIGEAVTEEWNSTGANEEAFLALVEKYSDDEYTNENGGLYEELAASGLNDDLKEWMLDESRKEGDFTSILSTDSYTYLMYYLGQGRPEWKVSIAGTLLSQTLSEYLSEISEPFEVSDPKGSLTYIKALEKISRTQDESSPESGSGEDTDGSEASTEDAQPEESSAEGTDNNESTPETESGTVNE